MPGVSGARTEESSILVRMMLAAGSVSPVRIYLEKRPLAVILWVTYRFSSQHEVYEEPRQASTAAVNVHVAAVRKCRSAYFATMGVRKGSWERTRVF